MQIKKNKPKLNFKHRDDSLLLLQKSITSKISKTKDETLIKFYLQQVRKISEQRLAFRKMSAVSEVTFLEEKLMGNEIKKLYEDIRNILLQTNRIQDSINELKQKKLRDVLSEMLKTSQTELMVFLNVVYEIEQCETDSEIDNLLESFPVPESEVMN